VRSRKPTDDDGVPARSTRLTNRLRIEALSRS
jgi:hypothetical protein